MLGAAGVGVPAVLGGTLGGGQQPQQPQQPYSPDPYRPNPYSPDPNGPDPYRHDPYRPDPYRPDPYRHDPYGHDPNRQGYARSYAGRGAFMEPAMAMAVAVSYLIK